MSRIASVLGAAILVAAVPALAQDINVNAEGTKVKVKASGDGSNATVQVETSGGKKARTKVSGKGKPVEMSTDVSINHGKVIETYRCNGHSLSVLAGECNLVLQGECTALRITGGHNTVRIEGSIGSVDVTGANNTVTWSSAKNPTAPKVGSIGADNRIEAAD